MGLVSRGRALVTTRLAIIRDMMRATRTWEGGLAQILVFPDGMRTYSFREGCDVDVDIDIACLGEIWGTDLHRLCITSGSGMCQCDLSCPETCFSPWLVEWDDVQLASAVPFLLYVGWDGPQRLLDRPPPLSTPFSPQLQHGSMAAWERASS